MRYVRIGEAFVNPDHVMVIGQEPESKDTVIRLRDCVTLVVPGESPESVANALDSFGYPFDDDWEGDFE